MHQKEPKLHTSGNVEHEVARRKLIGEKTSQKPADKIADWMSVLEKTHTGHNKDPKVMDRIKRYYHKENVIHPENVPESVFLLEQRIAREQGHGNIEITEEYKEKKINEIIADQKASLDRLVNYLSSDDADYPAWGKYWAFKGMLQMGKFEKKKVEKDGEKKEVGRFGKRTKDTVAAFPVLNARALAETISAMEKKIEEKQKPKKERGNIANESIKLDDAEFKQLLSSESFEKIYTQFLIEMPEYSTEGLRETRGQWKKYEQGSSPKPLVESLEGYPLEWCTANMDTAKGHLEGGDFHVYYSIDDTGEAKIPRLAMRMNGKSEIGEVRGIAPDQNIDPYINEEKDGELGVLDRKLQDFGQEGEDYKKKAGDMRRLTKIDESFRNNNELGKEDLRFLYKIDEELQGFGYGKDPRIKEILKGRDIKSDIALAVGCRVDQVSTTKEEALSGDIKYHYGYLDLSGLQSAEGLVLPEGVGGYLDLNELQSAEKEKLREKYPHLKII